MAATHNILTHLGWLFSFFQIFYWKKEKTLRLRYSFIAGVGNDPRDRKFNIPRQTAMYDAQGKFQKLWLQQSLF